MAIAQGVYSDVVLNTAGQAVQGASVALYSTSAWAAGVLPTGSPPSPAPNPSAAVATATTDITGSFSIRQLAVDDYHVLITYTPPGGTQIALWRYNVTVGPQGLVSRSYKGTLGKLIPRFLARLASGQNVSIMAIGDGVTVGYNATGTVSGGWVALLAAKIAAALPNAQVVRFDPNSYGVTSDAAIPSWSSTSVQAGTTLYGNLQSITVINAGVTGDTALRCIRRLANFTSASWSAPPDLYLIMLGLGEMTSDTTRAGTPLDFAAGLTGLINLLRAQGAEAIILTPAANSTVANFDDYCNAARGVAASTGCGLVDIRQLFLDHYVSGGANDGYDPWLSTGGGDHFDPTDAGHAAIAAEVFKALDVFSELPSAGRMGVGTELERIRLLNTAPTPIVFTGTWAALTQANNASGRDYTSSTAGDHLDFNARFTDLYMFARRWHDGGQVTVTIDGNLIGTFDLYRANPTSTVDVADFNTAIVPQERILLATGLSDTWHQVRIAVAATHNASSSGYAFRFDCIEALRLRHAENVVEAVSPVLQRVQAGVVNCVFAGSATAGANVVFPVAYTNASPIVVAVVQWNTGDYFAYVGTPSLTSVQINAARRDGTNVNATVPVAWFAIG